MHPHAVTVPIQHATGTRPASRMNGVSTRVAFCDEVSVLPHCLELHRAPDRTGDLRIPAAGGDFRMSGRKAVDALRPLPELVSGSTGSPG